MKYFICTIAFLTLSSVAITQELNSNVKINIQKLQTVDPQVFETLEQAMVEFLNNQKWTSEFYETEERINCNFILTIQEERSPTRFKADLAIQASRPVYGSDYETSLLNHVDRDVTFTYEQFQPLQFSINGFNDNLSAVLSFYVYLILGLDADSFELYGGEPYLQTAQEIVNNIPQNIAAGNLGWRALDGDRNRFWIVENLLSPRVRPMRKAFYQYHRLAMDIMAEDVDVGRAIMIDALEEIRKVNQAYPNSMIVQMFSNAKSNETLEIYKRGTRSEQDKFINIMTKIDATNASKYRAVR